MPERIDREAGRPDPRRAARVRPPGRVRACGRSSTPWFGAALAHPRIRPAQACDLAARLSTHELLPLLIHRVGRASEETGLAAAAWLRRVRGGRAAAVRRGARRRCAYLDPAVYAADPARLRGRGRRRGRAGPARAAGRCAGRPRALAAGTAEPSREDLRRGAARRPPAQLAEWQRGCAPTRACRGCRPAWTSWPASGADCERPAEPCCARYLAAARRPRGRSWPALAADQDTAWKLPRLYAAGRPLRRAGPGPAAGRAGPPAGRAGPGRGGVRPRLVLLDPGPDPGPRPGLRGPPRRRAGRDRRRLPGPRRAAPDGQPGPGPPGLGRPAARRPRTEHPLQARVIRKQAALRRRHLPLRRLLDQAGDVLFALKPCWAMSPLMVSQVLPATRLFDVVIFDEASQIVPADAIPSIMRGHQIVVAGRRPAAAADQLLPPVQRRRRTSRPRTTRAWSRSARASSRCSTRSGRCCPTAPLAWHYRSRDERLVAFSNAHIYGGALTTFPGVFARRLPAPRGGGPGSRARARRCRSPPRWTRWSS